MISETNEQLSELKSRLAAPFHVYVLVGDRAEGMNYRVAREFQRSLAGPRRRMSQTYCGMLDYCRDHYQALWRGYARAPHAVDLSGFVDLMRGLKGEISPDDYADVERNLAGLAQALFRCAFLFRPRQSTRMAYAEFISALKCRSVPCLPSAARQENPAGVKSTTPARSVEAAALVPLLDSVDSPRAETSKATVSPRVLPAAGPAHDPSAPGNPLAAAAASPRAWAKGPLAFTCVRVIEEARQVKTFCFAGRGAGGLCYRPGQFMTIEPVIGGKVVPRSYTIASSPTRSGLLEITVKRVRGGLVSNWLHDNMKVGKELRVRGPFGKFSCVNFPRDKYLFLSAGSGITPVMSMLRYLYDLAAPVDIIFFHSATTELDVVFRRELDFYAGRDPRVHVHISLTGNTDGGSWNGLRGRLDNTMLRQIAPDLMDRFVLACGPGGFMEKAKQLLAGNGFPLGTQFDEESFVPKQSRDMDGLRPQGSGERRKVVFVRSSKSLEISSEDTILEAAEKCGIEIPSSCRQGRCGTCRATKLSGEVIMPGQEALTPDEVAGGEILTCVGQANSSTVEVEL